MGWVIAIDRRNMFIVSKSILCKVAKKIYKQESEKKNKQIEIIRKEKWLNFCMLCEWNSSNFLSLKDLFYSSLN